MAEANRSPTTTRGVGVVTVRQRPALALMKVSLRAAEATLELGLARLKKQCEAASHWLRRLNAQRVEFGEPHFADQPSADPLKRRMEAAAAQALGRQSRPSSSERKLEVCVILTAIWDIAALSAEELLVFVDRLRYEAAEDDPPAAEPAEEPTEWSSPEELIRYSMAQVWGQGEENREPQFLFIAKLSEEQLATASTEAFALARRNAENLARAMGMRVAQASYVNFGVGDMETSRTDLLMARQRSWSLLAGCSYTPGENEMISDDPRSAEFRVRADVSYYLE